MEVKWVVWLLIMGRALAYWVGMLLMAVVIAKLVAGDHRGNTVRRPLAHRWRLWQMRRAVSRERKRLIEAILRNK